MGRQVPADAVGKARLPRVTVCAAQKHGTPFGSPCATRNLTQEGKQATGGDFPHLLVYGPSGAGKKTRINAILREIFGNNVDKVGIVQRVFTTPSGKKLEIPIISSNYHMEMNPSDVGTQDRLVVQELIKELAQTQQIDANATRKFKGKASSSSLHRSVCSSRRTVVVITEADALTRDAQSALRRTMEKYMQNLRIILVANNTSKLMAPIRSRCLLVRVAAPATDEVPSPVAHSA